MSFPDRFIWGAASSAFQIEGAAFEDGKRASIWDYYAHAAPDEIENFDLGDTACDFYHRYREDIALMAAMGVKNYRMSISWARVLPSGTGKPNKAGLLFYSNVVDTLLEYGITPWITLYHWDLPLELYRRGGWMNPEVVTWFAEYTRLMVDTLSDRVTDWITLNEPQVFIGAAFNSGRFAPFTKAPLCDQLLMAHNALLAHGSAVDVIREYAKRPARIGIAPTCWPKLPANEDDPDCIEAARRMTFSTETSNLCAEIGWYTDALYLGHYPEDGMRKFHKQLPDIKPGDMEQISRPLDFFGMNHYGGHPVDAEGKPASRPAGAGYNAINWSIADSSIYWNARFMHDRYHQPIIFTENGFAGTDFPSRGGSISDPQRAEYLRRVVGQMNRAIDYGADIRGYFYWSLTDNMEWASGYRPRFGLIHIDFDTLKRTPKESCAYYRDIIETNGTIALA